jgi:murein DD-endopeptidase MepM/ murein hydrolase activator NlpD
MKRFVIAGLMAASVASALAWPGAAGADTVGTGYGPGSERSPGQGTQPGGAPSQGTYAWPVVGPVIRGFEPPHDPYGSGHRGIDIAVPFGTPVAAANDGVVAFAGWIGGSLYVSIDHPDGVRTTYSWLSSVAVRRGNPVRRGDLIATTGHGHPEIPSPHLHFGARVGGTYIDPMILLGGADLSSLIRLAPLYGFRR